MTGHPKHIAINYIEFPCKDPQAIKRFYSRVFGWIFQDWGEEYISFSDGNLEGGFTTAEPVNSGGARVILYSCDLESTLASVKAAGGTIHKEIFAFPGGRRFHFLDPDGNHLAVWAE
jgi:predicted enzyme related to lactoylglutathione lyase